MRVEVHLIRVRTCHKARALVFFFFVSTLQNIRSCSARTELHPSDIRQAKISVLPANHTKPVFSLLATPLRYSSAIGENFIEISIPRVRSVNMRHKQYKIKKCIVAQCTTITRRLQLASCCIDWSAEYPFMLWQSAVNLESLQCRYKSGVKCWFEFTCRVPLRPLISWSKM